MTKRAALAPVRLYHHARTDTHAVVSVEQRADGAWVVSVARGPGPRAVREAQRLGPFLESEAAKARVAVVQGLRAEGYETAGVGAARRDLESENPARRAHAARRLARARHAAAVDPLLELARAPRTDISTIIESLARLGDRRALPIVRAETERKLLSRRRAAEEGLRLLGDAQDVAQVRARARARLPDPLPEVLGSAAMSAETRSARLLSALNEIEGAAQAAAAETLYEIDDPDAAEAVRAFVRRVDVAQPHVWRHVKSVWKRAMIRGDAATVGWVAWRVEQRGRSSHGATATLHSGFDGQLRTVRVFSRKTVDYVRRRTWRWLREIARAEPARYPFAAALILAPYAQADGQAASGAPGTQGCYALHEILLGQSLRFRLDARAMRFRPLTRARTLAREEAFPQLWDAQPLAYVRVLASARHPLARRFALEALAERHPRLLEQAPVDDLVGMSRADDARVVDLALGELRRRFDPLRTELELVRCLCASSHDTVRNTGLRWMNETARRWLIDVDVATAFLEIEEPLAREVAVRLAVASAPALGADARRRWTSHLLDRLEGDETHVGAHAAFADVLLRAFANDTLALCPLPRALTLIERGTEPALAVGAQVLARKPGALDLLGVPAALALSEHDKVAVRRAAHALLWAHRGDLQRNPTPAFTLLDSDWEDSRATGRALVEQLGPDGRTLEQCLAIADLSRADALPVARAYITAALDGLDATELVARLAQHPAALMRLFALEIADTRVKGGVVALLRIERLFRAPLWASPSSSKEQRASLQVLERRGMADEGQAEVVSALLRDYCRLGCTRDVREKALTLLVRLRRGFPRIDTPVAFVEGRV